MHRGDTSTGAPPSGSPGRRRARGRRPGRGMAGRRSKALGAAPSTDRRGARRYSGRPRPSPRWRPGCRGARVRRRSDHWPRQRGSRRSGEVDAGAIEAGGCTSIARIRSSSLPRSIAANNVGVYLTPQFERGLCPRNRSGGRPRRRPSWPPPT